MVSRLCTDSSSRHSDFSSSQRSRNEPVNQRERGSVYERNIFAA